MSELRFIQRAPGYVVSECGMYECSITRKDGKQRILVFAHTGEINNPVICIGHAETPESAKKLAKMWGERNANR